MLFKVDKNKRLSIYNKSFHISLKIFISFVTVNFCFLREFSIDKSRKKWKRIELGYNIKHRSSDGINQYSQTVEYSPFIETRKLDIEQTCLSVRYPEIIR